jgi:glycosyltransferase involved in cell wall biosynthesis
MHIINAMFSCGLGGIEQSFIDYSEAIVAQGHKVSVIIHPKAQIKSHLIGSGINILNVNNLGPWDACAKSYLKKILRQCNADIIIAHGNRAASLLKDSAKSVNCPIIGVTHNYKLYKQIGFDAMFATTLDLKKELIKLGQKEETIFIIPNMIKEVSLQNKEIAYHKPPVIGTMGRFVKKKGFENYLKSLAILKKKHIDFKAVIGGSGEEEKLLIELSKNLDINDKLEFTGWIGNKKDFFDSIDIFVLPSIHEPFGIILLEAFIHGKPVITTNCEGPSEIATHNFDALIVEKENPNKLADALIELIKNEQHAALLAKNAKSTVKTYDMDIVGHNICENLKTIINSYNSARYS